MSDSDKWSCLGTCGGHIEVVPGRSQWHALFEEEAARIQAACGDAVAVIEHIGSTSVPGLAAKPILDIMPGFARTEDGHRTVEPMKSLGYEYFGEHGIPGRFYFDRKEHGATVIHVHMFEIGSHEWRRHIVFRDVLRANPIEPIPIGLVSGVASAHGPNARNSRRRLIEK